MSLSARRAWIEMLVSVSTNFCSVRSLSARRAWIEMDPLVLILLKIGVALRKESVDRNYIIKITEIWGAGRSPQGERG